MKSEPVGVTTAMRLVLYALVQGLVIFGVVALTPEQHGYLTITVTGAIEAVMWLITRNEVWAPTGQPTHPPTEELWTEKLAAAQLESDRRFAEAFTATGHPSPAPTMDEYEAAVDDINPEER